MQIWDINNVAFSIWNYPVSYIELIGTIVGLISVFLATKSSLWTWSTGIINEVAFFIIFFQIQLYADMFLQVYYFAITIYGWYYWTKDEKPTPVTKLSSKEWKRYLFILVSGTMACAWFLQNIHLLFPKAFSIPAAYPIVDSFLMVLSMIANYLLAKKKLETWLFWMIVNSISVVLFLKKGVLFMGFEYALFLILAFYGYYNWKKTSIK